MTSHDTERTTRNLVISLVSLLSLIAVSGCTKATPGVYRCEDKDEIDAIEYESIRSASFGVLEELSSGMHEDLWQQAHPIMKDSVPEGEFATGLEQVKAQLTDIGNANILDTRLIRMFGGTRTVHEVICGVLDVDSPKHLRVIVPEDVKIFAVCIIEIPGEPIAYTLSIHLAKDEGRFKLVQFSVNPSSYKGANASHYVGVAEKWIASDRLFSGWLAYSMAERLSYLGPGLKTGTFIQVNQQLSALKKNKRLQNEQANWDLGGVEYKILGIGLIGTLSDISPLISYLSHKELGAGTTDLEASSLMDYLEKKYPELNAEFDAVLFQAYSETPSDPHRSYPVFRVPKQFKTKES